MYQINKTENNITKLKQCLFSDLGFKERENLQEWIAKNPEVLGEDLLIIQKEFDGFNDTNERLDLLALDKDGSLVIIENKLDDTGKDVVWQALKYTSYCSTLSTSQIIKIYQNYLNNTSLNEDAKSLLIDFLDLESDEELILNKNDQRIMFVANNYRKEVTSTVLWLLDHDIKIKCFKATPYSLNDELFLQIDQIIPVPETAEFMIDMKEKVKEEVKIKGKIAQETDLLLYEFWTTFKSNLSKHNIDFISNRTPGSRWYINFSKGKALYGFVFGRQAPRVEIYFPHDSEKILFDTMMKNKEYIDKNFDGEIVWERLEGKKASRIKFEMSQETLKDIDDFKNKESWEQRIEWFRESFKNFYIVINPIWEKVQKEIN